MNSYYRKVRDYLVEAYGVDPGRIVNGGSHDAFVFEYGGQRHRITLGHDDRARSLQMKLQDIRRALGPVPTSATTPTPTPIPIPIPAPDTTVVGDESADEKVFVAAYRGKAPNSIRLRFSVATHLAETLFGEGRRVEVETITSESWLLRSSSDPITALQLKSRKGGAADFVDLDAHSDADFEPFGRSPAEATVVDGQLLVDLSTERRVPLKRQSNRRRHLVRQAIADLTALDLRTTEQATDIPEYAEAPNDQTTAAPEIVAVTDPTSAATIQWAEGPTEEQMREVLRTLRAVERAGTYELVRTVSGRWEFRPRARAIRLED